MTTDVTLTASVCILQMDVRGGKRGTGPRWASRGAGTSRGAGNPRGAGSSRGMGSSRGVVSSRGVRGWRGKRGRGSSRGRGGRMGNTAKDPVLHPADVPLTSDEQMEDVPGDKSTGTKRDKTSVAGRGQGHISGQVNKFIYLRCKKVFKNHRFKQIFLGFRVFKMPCGKGHLWLIKSPSKSNKITSYIKIVSYTLKWV